VLDSAHSLSGGSLRSRGRRLRLYNGDETRDRIASFEHPRYLLDFPRIESPFNDWSQEVQGLTTEEVHRTKRF